MPLISKYTNPLAALIIIGCTPLRLPLPWSVVMPFSLAVSHTFSRSTPLCYRLLKLRSKFGAIEVTLVYPRVACVVVARPANLELRPVFPMLALL